MFVIELTEELMSGRDVSYLNKIKEMTTILIEKSPLNPASGPHHHGAMETRD
jgi:hypothetical protein